MQRCRCLCVLLSVEKTTASKVSLLTLISQSQKQRDGRRISCELQVQCGALTQQPTLWDIIQV